MKNLNKLKKYEERLEKVIEDPEKIIQIIKKVINLACYDLDGSRVSMPLVPDEQKVAFWEFVKYYGNFQLERAEDNRWDVEKQKKEIVEWEEAIGEIDGFSSYELPDGLVIKYR